MGWVSGGSSMVNIAHKTTFHKQLSDLASPESRCVSRDVAQSLALSLDGRITLPAGECDTQPYVIVLPHDGDGTMFDPDTGLPYVNVLLAALGIKKTAAEDDEDDSAGTVDLWGHASVTSKDWSKRYLCMYGDDDEEDDEADSDDDDDHLAIPQFRAATKIMNDELDNHFELNFTEQVVCAPVIYGGMASDGNVVGILGMRVWT